MFAFPSFKFDKIFYLRSGWFSFCTQNPIFQCVLTSFLLDFFRRLVPLLQAMWVQADVILDARQTWTYYKHAQPNDSDYAKWADVYMKETNSTHKQTQLIIAAHTACSGNDVLGLQ